MIEDENGNFVGFVCVDVAGGSRVEIRTADYARASVVTVGLAGTPAPASAADAAKLRGGRVPRMEPAESCICAASSTPAGQRAGGYAGPGTTCIG